MSVLRNNFHCIVVKEHPNMKSVVLKEVVICSKGADGINSKKCKPGSDCSSRSSLIWDCTVCQCLSVRKLNHYGINKGINFCPIIVEEHPNMKSVVVKEVEMLLFRPNIPARAQ